MRRVAPAGLYALLALVVAGPLLAPGLVLAVDLAPVPHPHLASDYWGVPAGTHLGTANRLPLDLLFVAAGHLGAVAVLEKLILLAIVFLAGLGMHRLAPAGHPSGRVFAGVLYAVNPFVYDRLYTGQWYLLLGYALVPWAFRSFLPLARGDWRSAWRFGLAATLVGAASPHMLALLAILVAAATLAQLVCGPGRRRTLASIGLGAAITTLGSLYWLLPRQGVSALWHHVSTGQLSLYQPVADHTFGAVATVGGLYGYWNDATPIKAHLWAWPLLALGLAAVAALGLAVRRRDPAAWAVAVSAVFGLVLALGTRGPLTGGIFRVLLEHLPPARSFRESQKGAALIAFGYAYLGAAGVSSLQKSLGHARRTLPALIVAASIALPFLYGYRELWGLWGSLATSSYPPAWSQARDVLDHEATGANTLFLPWHGYLALSFAHHRVVANPAPAFFNTPILASRSTGEGRAGSDNSDPRDAALSAMLAAGPRIHDLGSCLAAFGVSRVLLADVADASRYAFLARQTDLVVERRWPGLVLYRNTRPASLAMLERTTTSDPCAADLNPVAANVVSPAEIRLVRPIPSGERLVVPTAYDPNWTLAGLQSVSFAGLNSFVSNGRARDVGLSTARGFAHDYMLGALGLLLALASSVLARRPTSGGPVAVAEPLSASRQLWVVLPTYNEAANLEEMIGALVAVFDKAGLDGRILVVDDDSPDGTGVIADAIAKREERVDVLHRGAKEGLGPAYVAGFRHALERGAGLLVQMDCDFSHDPNDVPRLAAAARECDVVLGSRYVRGGAVHDWSFGRRLLSRGGCFYARRVLALPIRDLTGGFKCYRREALERIELGSLRASGYGFQIETAFRAQRAGLLVRELPIVFRDRTNGSSKMTPRIGLEALILVPQLRLATAGSRRPYAAPAETQAAAAAS